MNKRPNLKLGRGPEHDVSEEAKSPRRTPDVIGHQEDGDETDGRGLAPLADLCCPDERRLGGGGAGEQSDAQRGVSQGAAPGISTLSLTKVGKTTTRQHLAPSRTAAVGDSGTSGEDEEQ